MPKNREFTIKMGTTSFAQEWKPNPASIETKIRNRLLAGSALTAIITAGAVATSAITPDFTLLIGTAVAFQAGLFMWSSKNIVPDMARNDHLIQHEGFQQIAEKLIAKAGLNTQVEVRIYKGHERAGLIKIQNTPPGYDHHDWNIEVMRYKDSHGTAKALIIIGQKILSHLTKEELTAQLAHEIGHLMSPPTHVTMATAFKHKFITWMFDGALVHVSPWAAAGYVANFFNHHAGLLKIARINEHKADRNSVALFPHQSALLDGLEMIDTHHQLMLSMETRLQRFARRIRSEHDETSLRQVRVLGHLAEAQIFYRAHDIANDLEDILPDMNKHHVADGEDIKWQEPVSELSRLINVRGSWRKAALLKDLKDELSQAQAYHRALEKLNNPSP